MEAIDQPLVQHRQHSVLQRIDLAIQIILYALAAITAPTFFIPLMIQFVVGVYQLIGAIVATAQWNRLSPKSQKQLKIYWLLVGIYALIAAGSVMTLMAHQDELMILIWAIIPWGIAIYYTTISWTRHYYPKTRKKRGYLNNLNF